jgi:hypothetical protein
LDHSSQKKRKPYGIGRWNDGFAEPLWITPGLAAVVSGTDLKPEDGLELHLSAAEDRKSFSGSEDTAPVSTDPWKKQLALVDQLMQDEYTMLHPLKG